MSQFIDTVDENSLHVIITYSIKIDFRHNIHNLTKVPLMYIPYHSLLSGSIQLQLKILQR